MSRGKIVEHLSRRRIKELLIQYPTITSVEELCAIKDEDITKCTEEEIARAKYYIDRNRLRMQVNLKMEIYRKSQTDTKAKEQLYKLMCDEGELPRLGIKTPDHSNINVSPTIEIKSSDPDIKDKITNL